MRSLIVLPLFTLILLTRSVAYADGLIQQLPVDGSWVQFDMKGEGETGGKEDTIAGKITIRSVGRVSHEGGQCRWIEFRAETADHIDIVKVLVPEKYLAKSSNTVNHIIRGWRKSGDEEPQEVREPTPEIIALIGPPLNRESMPR